MNEKLPECEAVRAKHVLEEKGDCLCPNCTSKVLVDAEELTGSVFYTVEVFEPGTENLEHYFVSFEDQSSLFIGGADGDFFMSLIN